MLNVHCLSGKIREEFFFKAFVCKTTLQRFVGTDYCLNLFFIFLSSKLCFFFARKNTFTGPPFLVFLRVLKLLYINNHSFPEKKPNKSNLFLRLGMVPILTCFHFYDAQSGGL